VADEMVVENETAEVVDKRNSIIEMLFVEGNHYCPSCEVSGNCELQAMAYRFSIDAPKYEYQFPNREVDASHPDILLDRNRCILCGRCVKTAKAIDGKTVFGFVGRGKNTRLAVNSRAKLKDVDVDVTDACVSACPVGAIIKKRTAFATPIGERKYDHEPIGSQVDAPKKGAK
jgi:[NiFe] hydrogenase diaphorase moiety small subunit